MSQRPFFLMVWILLVAHLSRGTMAAQVGENAKKDEQAKGRQVVGEVCVACHTNILRVVGVHKMSPEQWKETVYAMIGRGAQVMPDEIAPVIAYLAANSGNNNPSPVEGSRERRAGAARADQQAPEGTGRAILQRSCQQCHDLATATQKPSSEDWNAVIAKMMIYGAKLTPEDQRRLAEYLAGLTNQR